MRATVFHGPRDVRVEDVPDAGIEQPTDVVVRVTAALICGSDLWPYRGVGTKEAGTRIGHEFAGVVEAVGCEVATLRPGDRVLAPFTWSDGTCDHCLAGGRPAAGRAASSAPRVTGARARRCASRRATAPSSRCPPRPPTPRSPGR